MNHQQRRSFTSGHPREVKSNTSFKMWKEIPLKNITEGQQVYARDDLYGWLAAVVVEAPEGLMGMVTLDLMNGQIVKRRLTGVLLRPDNSNLVKYSSLTELTLLNEATVLDCLHQRYTSDFFYTLAGSTLVAINPFKEVPKLYSLSKIWAYHGRNSEVVTEPHVYMIADKAYSCMVHRLGLVNQSIIVSGESGAGKTVSAKHLLRYLTIVSSPDGEIDLESSVSGSVIERRVLDSNPLLEAFGNASTPRNDNSSRFGKFIQLQFHRNGTILGGVIQTYLLEKTRVVHQGAGENNFHIFYQLLGLQEEAHLPQWLEGIKSEIQASRLECSLPTNGKRHSVLTTINAMSEIGINQTSQAHIFQTLLAILHLTTLKFLPERDGEASNYSDDQDLDPARLDTARAKEESARLLGISSDSLHYALLNRSIVSGGGCDGTQGRPSRRSVFHKPVVVAEAESRRDCLATMLYSKLFDWLVMFINHQIKVDKFDYSINLLDIYGFEAFAVNSLEQLCINYANERLQQHYVVHFLRDLQAEYEREGIAWTNIVYTDNKQCVDALDGSTGVFGVLNEDVYLNRRSVDYQVCSRIVEACADPRLVRKPHAGTYGTQFLVKHYAGEVLYSVTEAVTKNKDSTPLELTSLLGSSCNEFILELFSENSTSLSPSPSMAVKSKRNKTVLTKFKSSLDGLLTSLGRTNVHYIRCIKPNPNSRQAEFDRSFVLHQLQACGIVQSVEICKRGFPIRMTYREFVYRYGVLMRLKGKSPHKVNQTEALHKGHSAKGNKEDEDMSGEAFIERVVAHLLQDKITVGIFTEKEKHQHQSASILVAVFEPTKLAGMEAQFGFNKIFLTQKQFEHLEQNRTSTVHCLVCRAQAWWRGCLQRTRYRRARRAALMIQTLWRAHCQRQKFRKMREAVTVIQRGWGAHKLRRSLGSLSRASKVVKRSLLKWVRRGKFKKALKKLQKQEEEESKAKMYLVEMTDDDEEEDAKGQSCLSAAVGGASPCRDIPRLSQDSIDFPVSATTLVDFENFPDFKPGQSPSLSNLLLDEETNTTFTTSTTTTTTITTTTTTTNLGAIHTGGNPGSLTFEGIHSHDEILSSEPWSEDSGIAMHQESGSSNNAGHSPNKDQTFDHHSYQLQSSDLPNLPGDLDRNGSSSVEAGSRSSSCLELSGVGVSDLEQISAKRSRGDVQQEETAEEERDQGSRARHRSSSATRSKRRRSGSWDENGRGDGGVKPPRRRAGRKKEDLKMGNGIISCRRLTRAGYRFHVKSSILKHGHRTHQYYLPQGLPDALAEEGQQEENK